MKYQTESDIRRLLTFTYGKDPQFHMLALACYYHGMRISEALALTNRDVDGGLVNIKSLKHGNTALEPLVIVADPVFSEAALAVHAKTTTGLLFPISRQAVDKKLKKYCGIVGIPAGVAHMHALRHAQGLAIWEETHSPDAVQQALRHKSQSSSMIYIHASSAKQAYEAVAARAARLAVL